ncbi:MAG: hypothetical protein PUP91_02065 [Rhizonema sp. PD37]|nr:hypothetical protein [Rhizonema sp. PD37]
MENSQSVQDQSNPAKTPESEPENSQAKESGGNSLIHLFGQQPWLLIAGLLAIFLGSAGVALYSLGYVGHVEKTEQEEPTVQAEVVPVTNTPPATSNTMPLWMVAAIALSCASGCLIILRLLNRPQQRQKVQQHLNRYQERLKKRRVKIVVPPSAKNVPVLAKLKPQKPSVKIPVKVNTVTVLPPEKSPKVNKAQDSLANSLDIRKQTSLSSILRK